jgi:hypothetical protein
MELILIFNLLTTNRKALCGKSLIQLFIAIVNPVGTYCRGDIYPEQNAHSRQSHRDELMVENNIYPCTEPHSGRTVHYPGI